MGINTILFDLDGTLIDTKDFFRGKNLETNFRLVEEKIPGLSKDKVKKAIFELYSLDRVIWIQKNFSFSQALLQKLGYNASIKEGKEMDEKFTEQLKKHLVIKKGSIKMIKTLKKRGFKIGIVANYEKKVIDMIIKKMGLKKSFFDTIVPIEKDIKRFLVPFVVASELLNENYKNILYVGDSPINDIISPKKIKINTVDINEFKKYYFLLYPEQELIIDLNLIIPNYKKNFINDLKKRLFYFYKRKNKKNKRGYKQNFEGLIKKLIEAENSKKSLNIFIDTTKEKEKFEIMNEIYQLILNSCLKLAKNFNFKTYNTLLALKKSEYEIKILSELPLDLTLFILDNLKLLPYFSKIIIRKKRGYCKNKGLLITSKKRDKNIQGIKIKRLEEIPEKILIFS